jgi:hypothetical protein
MKKLLKIVIIIIVLLVSVVVLGVLALAVMAKMYTNGAPMLSGEKTVGPYIINFPFDYKYQELDEYVGGRKNVFYFMLDYPSFDSAPMNKTETIQNQSNMKFSMTYSDSSHCISDKICVKDDESSYQKLVTEFLNPERNRLYIHTFDKPIANKIGDLSYFELKQVVGIDEYYFKGDKLNPDFYIICSEEKIGKRCYNFRKIKNNIMLFQNFPSELLDDNYQDFFNKTDAFLNQYITTRIKE